MKKTTLALLSALLVGLYGCSTKPTPVTAADTGSSSGTPSSSSADTTSVDTGTKGFGETGVDKGPKTPPGGDSGYLRDVFFDFDRFDVREDQRSMLAQDAELLRKKATTRVTVEGHCDERGTAQYNLALGEKRGHTVKDYLTSLGIDSSRITVISLGKERPFATGHEEDSWSKNRRAHFVVTTP